MSADWLEKTVLAHYVRHWGDPARVTTCEPDLVPDSLNPLKVAEFSLPQDRLTIYASIGMSRAPLPGTRAEHDHRTEVFVATFQTHVRLFQLIATLASYPHRRGVFVGVEHTIPIGEGVMPGSSLTSVLLVDPYLEPPGFGRIEALGRHIQVL